MWYNCTHSDFMFDCCVVGYTSLISSFGYHILPQSGKFIVACFSDGVTYHCVDLVSHTFWNCFYGVDAPQVFLFFLSESSPDELYLSTLLFLESPIYSSLKRPLARLLKRPLVCPWKDNTGIHSHNSLVGRYFWERLCHGVSAGHSHSLPSQHRLSNLR